MNPKKLEKLKKLSLRSAPLEVKAKCFVAYPQEHLAMTSLTFLTSLTSKIKQSRDL